MPHILVLHFPRFCISSTQWIENARFKVLQTENITVSLAIFKIWRISISVISYLKRNKFRKLSKYQTTSQPTRICVTFKTYRHSNFSVRSIIDFSLCHAKRSTVSALVGGQRGIAVRKITRTNPVSPVEDFDNIGQVHVHFEALTRPGGKLSGWSITRYGHTYVHLTHGPRSSSGRGESERKRDMVREKERERENRLRMRIRYNTSGGGGSEGGWNKE